MVLHLLSNLSSGFDNHCLLMSNFKSLFQFKNLLPFIAAFGAFHLANNSPMWRQMNAPSSAESEIKPIPVEEVNNSFALQ